MILWNMSWLIFHTLMNFGFPFDCLSPHDFHQMKQWFGQHYSCNKYFPQGSCRTALLSFSPPHSSGQSCFGSAPKLSELARFRWFLLTHMFENWAGLPPGLCLSRVRTCTGAHYRSGLWGGKVRPSRPHVAASSRSWHRTCCALLGYAQLRCDVLFTFR